MVSDSQKHKLIREFFIPDELKDDIAYCQRSLRDCVKVHQHFAIQCKRLSGAQQVQVKRFLLELEDEMRAIGKDQSGLVQDLTKRLKHFQRKTAHERRVKLEDDLANGYVAWVLSTHCELQGAPTYVPRAVAERLNETQLYQKYRLEALPNCEPDATKLTGTKLRKRPVLQTSLLKPHAERTQDANSAHQKKPSLTPPSTPPTQPQSLPPPPAVVKMPPSTTGSKRKVPPEQPIHVKMLRSRTANMVVVKPEPAQVKVEPAEPEHEQGNDSEGSSPTAAMVMQESPAVKRGRCNLRQALSKVQSSQKASQPTATNKLASAGRSNRSAAGALTSTAPGNRSPSSISSSDSSNSRASTPGTLTNASGRKQQQQQQLATEATNNTSDDSSNERFLPLREELPSQPCSTNELDQYGFLKHFGLYTIADSDALKGRKNERKRRSCCSTERKDFHYGRFDFFEQQLYVMQKRRQGANKRLLYIATSAEKANKKRKPWQNGGPPVPPPPPPPPPPPVVAAPATEIDRKLSLSESLAAAASLNAALMEPDVKLCFVCNKTGSTDTLSACTECCNIYHLSCHVDDVAEQDGEKVEEDADQTPPTDDGGDSGGDENQNHSAVQLLFPQRDNLCPICLPLAQGSKHKK